MRYPQRISKKHVTLSLSKGGNRDFIQRFREGVMLRHSKHGADGLIRTFTVAIIFCLLVSVAAWAQSNDTTHKNKSISSLYPSIASIYNKAPICIIDDKISYGDLTKSIDSIGINNVLNVHVIKGPEAKKMYGIKGAKGAVIIITKPFAISQYQKKLSNFSKKYKTYLQTHRNKDDSCSYILEGPIFLNDVNERVKKLYDIPAKKIKGVYFGENPWYNGGVSRKYEVIIGIKK